MPLVIPAGWSNCAYRFSLTGDAEEMIFTLGVLTPGPPGDVETLNALHAKFIEAWPAANILTGWTFLGIRMQKGNAPGPVTVLETTQAPVVGVNAGPSLPPNCAFLVQKRTALGGRPHRGRMYLPGGIGVGEDSVPSTGVMLEAQRAVLQTRVNLAFGTGDKGVLHDSLTPGALPPTVITSFRAMARLATIRRRLRP